jgi:energy-coupling factor transporter ATP-binding protein EcfA2
MSVELQRKVGVHQGIFCCPRTSLPSLQSIKEWVEFIDEYLHKKVLCRHDVEDINQAFEKLDQLERQIAIIPPECNSSHALQKLIDKIKSIVASATGAHLVGLYYLRNFADKELPIGQCFSKMHRGFEHSTEKDEEIASHLPCCSSVEEFDQDASALLGLDRSPEVRVTQILQLKKAKLQRRLDLNQRRKSEEYPAYFDELIENGYIHLYDYLIQMRSLPTLAAREGYIKNEMTFSSIAQVILETRKAIIQKVKSSIPSGSRRILFLLGRSGAGKSTAMCFLRRDRMVPKGSHYDSIEDKSGIIGHDEKKSCTFLPNVSLPQEPPEWIIVDFAGFEDSNSLLVNMGFEFALKKLVGEYKPKILVLESIANIEGKFVNVEKLGKRLLRLFGDNRENCFLGLTKYSKDDDVKQIKDIERQERERLAPTPEESELMGQIKALSDLNTSGLESKIESLKQQLGKIQQKRKQRSLSPEDMAQKAEYERRIKERENEFLNQLGLRKLIRFKNLEDSQCLLSCLEELSSPLPSESLPRTKLPVHEAMATMDKKDEDFLMEVFEASVVKDIQAKKNFQLEFKDFQAFEKAILESGFFPTLFSKSNPEIGEFFQLPEIDPQLVRSFEKKIVKDCVRVYMESVISTLNIALIDGMLKEVASIASPQKLDDLNKIKLKLRNYIMGLFGIPLAENPNDAKIQWEGLRQRCQREVNAVDRSFQRYYNLSWLITGYVAVLVKTPLAVGFGLVLPYSTATIVPLLGILALLKWNTKNQVKQAILEQTLDQSCKDLNEMYETLLRLKELEKIIQKREEIDEAFNSVKISLNSINALKESIQKRIEIVRAVYEEADWDKRVEFLVENRPSYVIPPGSGSFDKDYMLAYLYWVIEPGTSRHFEQNDFCCPGADMYLEAVGKGNIQDVKEKMYANLPMGSILASGIRILDSGVVLIIHEEKRSPIMCMPLNWHDSLTRALSAAAILKFIDSLVTRETEPFQNDRVSIPGISFINP